jgi:hypothetical protein
MLLLSLFAQLIPIAFLLSTRLHDAIIYTAQLTQYEGLYSSAE